MNRGTKTNKKTKLPTTRNKNTLLVKSIRKSKQQRKQQHAHFSSTTTNTFNQAQSTSLSSLGLPKTSRQMVADCEREVEALANRLRYQTVPDSTDDVSRSLASAKLRQDFRNKDRTANKAFVEYSAVTQVPEIDNSEHVLPVSPTVAAMESICEPSAQYGVQREDACAPNPTNKFRMKQNNNNNNNKPQSQQRSQVHTMSGRRFAETLRGNDKPIPTIVTTLASFDSNRQHSLQRPSKSDV